jgi:hypothetical protein
MAVWYNLWSLGIFYTFWFVWTTKNLATLTTLETIRVLGIIIHRKRFTSFGKQNKTKQNKTRHHYFSISRPPFSQEPTSVARWHILKRKKSQFGLILEGLTMQDVGIFYGQLVHFTAIWYTLSISSSFGIFISRFGMLYQEKSGNPGSNKRLTFYCVTKVMFAGYLDEAVKNLIYNNRCCRQFDLTSRSQMRSMRSKPDLNRKTKGFF